MWKEIPPFSFSAGERKIMAHFVVKTLFRLRLRRAVAFVQRSTSRIASTMRDSDGLMNSSRM